MELKVSIPSPPRKRGATSVDSCFRGNDAAFDGVILGDQHDHETRRRHLRANSLLPDQEAGSNRKTRPTRTTSGFLRLRRQRPGARRPAGPRRAPSEGVATTALAYRSPAAPHSARPALVVSRPGPSRASMGSSHPRPEGSFRSYRGIRLLGLPLRDAPFLLHYAAIVQGVCQLRHLSSLNPILMVT
jgi:hypothetical protein